MSVPLISYVSVWHAVRRARSRDNHRRRSRRPSGYYPPPPVYVVPGPACYWTRGQPVWDAYRGIWVYPSVQVCE